MLQDVMTFVENHVFTLSTLVFVIASPLYFWMIFQSIRNRFFISVGTSVVFYIVFVTDLYMEWIPEVSTNLIISVLVNGLLIWIPAAIYQGEVELKNESEEDEGTLTILVQEEAEFREYVEEACNGKEKDEVCIVIEGDNCNNVPCLFREFAYKFDFPSDFDESWYAFEECMNDLRWLEAERCTIYIHNGDQILQGDMDNFNLFMSHLGDACLTWGDEREFDGFCVVMHCTPEKEEELMARLEKAKQRVEDVYEQEAIEIISDVNILQGSCYMEIFPNNYEGGYWNESSIFLTEENFGYIMPVFEKCCEEFDYCGVNGMDIRTWNEILKELEEMKQYLLNHPEPHSLEHIVGFIYDGVEEAFMKDYNENRKQLISMITEFQVWIEEQSKTTKVISVLGM
jgi:hypothetical protein